MVEDGGRVLRLIQGSCGPTIETEIEERREINAQTKGPSSPLSNSLFHARSSPFFIFAWFFRSYFPGLLTAVTARSALSSQVPQPTQRAALVDLLLGRSS